MTTQNTYYAPWSMNYLANGSQEQFAEYVRIRAKEDAPMLLTAYFGTSAASVSASNQKAQDLTRGKAVNADATVITRDDHNKIKNKYANLTQVAISHQVNVPDGINPSGNSSAPSQSLTTLHDVLKPVSGFVGSTLGTLTGVMKDPIGSIPDSISHLMGKSDVKSQSSFARAYQALKIEEISKIPSNVLGSLDNLVNKHGTFLNDVYGGAQELLKDLNQLQSKLFENIQKVTFAAIDSVIPINALTEFVGAATEFSAKINAISNMTGGNMQITQFAQTFQLQTQQLNQMVASPIEIAYRFTPPQLNQGQIMLSNPTAALENMLPEDLKISVGRIASTLSPALGGNMGYGLFGMLASIKSGVIEDVVKNFSVQLGVLPILNSTPTEPKSHTLAHQDTAYKTTNVYQGEAYRKPNYTPSKLIPEKTQ